MVDSCPECGNQYKKLGNHWQHNPSHRLGVSEKQFEVAKGVMMGDGCLNTQYANAYIQIETITKNYLEYLNNIFGELSTGVKKIYTAKEQAKRARESNLNKDAVEENYNDVYRLNTRHHPKFNQLDWSTSSESKVWPSDIELTPTVLKHFYACDGNWHNSSSANHIQFAASNELGNEKKINKIFSNSGLPTPSNYSKTKRKDGSVKLDIQFSADDSEKLWQYMGEPLPDFEYKWPERFQ